MESASPQPPGRSGHGLGMAVGLALAVLAVLAVAAIPLLNQLTADRTPQVEDPPPATTKRELEEVPPAPPRPAPARPRRVGDEIKRPLKTKHVPPQYPSLAQAARVQGPVVLEALIASNGKVQDVKVLRSIPLLDEAAIDAVKQWEFQPTVVNGTPVPVILTVTVEFTLQ